MIYNITVTKSAGGRSNGKSWTNVYKTDSDLPLDDPSWQGRINKLVTYEKALHLEDTEFLSARISTAAKEARGTKGTHRKFPLTGKGAVPLGNSEPYALQAVLVVELQTSLDDGGRKYYRNALSEAMVKTEGGNTSLSGVNIADMQNAADAMFTGQDQLDLVIGPDTALTAAEVSPVTGIKIVSVGFRDTKRRKKKSQN